jgi:hypothetical protein
VRRATPSIAVGLHDRDEMSSGRETSPCDVHSRVALEKTLGGSSNCRTVELRANGAIEADVMPCLLLVRNMLKSFTFARRNNRQQ